MLNQYLPNEVVAKVMFLQVSVCPQGVGGRVSASVHAGMPDPPPQTRQTPPDQADPPRPGRPPPRPGRHPPPHGTRQTPPGPGRQPLGPGRHPPLPQNRQTPLPPPGSRLQHTVYERPVRILLECILVSTFFCNVTSTYFLMRLIKYDIHPVQLSSMELGHTLCRVFTSKIIFLKFYNENKIIRKVPEMKLIHTFGGRLNRLF